MFKGKPSINKRNREMAARERQQERDQRRAQRSRDAAARENAPPQLDPETGLPLTEEQKDLLEFQAALKERREQETAETGELPDSLKG